MGNQEKIVQDYHGVISYFEKNKNKDLRVFVIDDDVFYLQVLKKQLSKNTNLKIHTFSTGEDSLYYLGLNPDLIIIDYHLDGTYKYAKKGNLIAKEIKKRLPDTEIIIISSDHKLSLVKKLQKKSRPKVFFKDDYLFEKIKLKSSDRLKSKKKEKFRSVLFVSIIIVLVVLLLV